MWSRDQVSAGPPLSLFALRSLYFVSALCFWSFWLLCCEQVSFGIKKRKDQLRLGPSQPLTSPGQCLYFSSDHQALLLVTCGPSKPDALTCSVCRAPQSYLLGSQLPSLSAGVSLDGQIGTPQMGFPVPESSSGASQCVCRRVRMEGSAASFLPRACPDLAVWGAGGSRVGYCCSRLCLSFFLCILSFVRSRAMESSRQR